jgi:hypothetical protein
LLPILLPVKSLTINVVADVADFWTYLSIWPFGRFCAAFSGALPPGEKLARAADLEIGDTAG